MRGSSAYLAWTSFLQNSERGLHLPQRSTTGSHSRLPATHRRGRGLKITRLTEYRLPAASADSGEIFRGNGSIKTSKSKRGAAAASRVSLLVCLQGAPESDCHKTEGETGHREPPCDWRGGSKRGREERGSLMEGGG